MQQGTQAGKSKELKGKEKKDVMTFTVLDWIVGFA